ncbi:outer membrane porin GjpA [Mycobacterium sp. RTGN5]|uniref:outer membrane porin GjpA n=1 Tax=Mycobacterium sp. RTGN5 TaxID=3016522 RepID=UPI0029C7505A|nr:outer membrane porin GjpA [Mycobacterium sp. RTGN5]
MPAMPRPFIAAGVAVVGTSAIAMSPVVVPPPTLRAEAAIQLTATTDWADVFSQVSVNAQALFDTWREAPAPILQQIAANLRTYLMELPDLPGIATQVQANFQAALAAPMAPDPSTLDSTHRAFYELLPAITQLPGIPDLLHLSISPTGKQLLAFSTTALSGVLLGMAGPILGPLVVLAASLESIRTDLTAATPDPASAMSTLANIPAAMTDAFLNGGEHVDLTALAKAFGPAIGVSFPDGVQVGMAVGGLLSPGGSIFNALDFAYDNDLLGVLHIHVPLATGTAVGPFGAMMEFARTIAKAIGWQGASSSAAALSPTAQSLVAANEVPRSVQSPGAARSVSIRSTNADKAIRTAAASAPADDAAKSAVGGRHRAQAKSAAAGPGKAVNSVGSGRHAARSAAAAASR